MIPTQLVSPSLFRQFRTAPLIQVIRRSHTTLAGIRYLTSTTGLHKNRIIHPVGEGEKAKTEDEEEDHRMINNNNPNPAISLPGGVSWPFSSNSSIDAALTTIIGLGLVFLGGVAYVTWYKIRVLNKMEQAFAKGYDPALELAGHVRHEGPREPTSAYDVADHLRRKEQSEIDSIVGGQETGHYWLLIGPKGGGKSNMVLGAMASIDAEGVSMCEAHPDLEVFRLRLGKALNFEYNEDTQTGLFQRRDPREGGPALDIERAFNKLEKVALRCHKKMGRPLVLIFNNVHLFPNDDAGRNMLLQIQQRAESWSESGILTIVFISDDLWPYITLREILSQKYHLHVDKFPAGKNHNRMSVISVTDLESSASLSALRSMRKQRRKENDTPSELVEAASIVGGRLAFLSKISRAQDMVEYAKKMMHEEKAWLLSQIGLIKDCDDDVMDEQKWSSSTWLLLREFVNMRRQQEKERDERIAATNNPASQDPLPLPVIPYHQCRIIMTRTDFLEELDRLNIISIDIKLGVRPDSMLILQAAREVVEEEGFDDLLQSVRDRIDEIEGLHRTAEVTFKDLGDGEKRMIVDMLTRRPS